MSVLMLCVIVVSEELVWVISIIMLGLFVW